MIEPMVEVLKNSLIVVGSDTLVRLTVIFFVYALCPLLYHSRMTYHRWMNYDRRMDYDGISVQIY
ncbi:hypothetical protein [Peribacillus frigoritolerans]|uniref:hypothetical protein n=1 Tax=Peribacillus castrilensis TaxID=2897690 RepID=UPI003DA3530C